MARIGIITFLHNDNYGSMLQAWALQRTVASLGHEPVLLNYRPSAKEKLRNLLTSGNSPRLVLEGLRKRAVRGSEAEAAAKHEALERFLQERMPATAPCADRAALRKASAGCSVLIAGSDQIWSPVWLNPVYFLDFAPDGCRRIAYAPSLGVSTLPDGRKARRMAALLKPFDRLSAREEEGATILRRLTGREVSVLPDPVFLLTREEWLAFAEPPLRDEPYLLCYFIGNRPDYWDAVRREAGKRGLRPLVLPVTAEAFAQPYDRLGGLTPPAWAGALAGAAHIVTDSFHGAAFASLLGVPCTVLRRYAEDDPESKNSRVDQLMRSLHQTDGFLRPSAETDRHLAALRDRGLACLRSAAG